LEYMSAEAYVERCHRLPSPVMSGPARGALKHFFYPGFTSKTGGLLREHDLMEQQAVFDRSAWLTEQGIAYTGQETLVSLFCYEPTALPNLLVQWAQAATPTRVLVTHGRAQRAIDRALSQLGQTWMGWQQLRLHPLPALSQTAFDRLLWACDVNAVRGEDSLVRALWAGKPVLWHIYPQDDGAHLPKLDALLQTLSVPAQWQQVHAAWNTPHPSSALVWNPLQTDVQACFTHAREKLLSQHDLCTQLITFINMHGESKT
jgi:uncharacterized repeat protein (TIGR03837 family)